MATRASGATPVERAAQAASAAIRVGPAGWSYRDWSGPVFPSPRPRGFDELGFLARFFDTIEINSTFYRPATADTARRWAGRVAANDRFRFTVKLWQRFTHERDTAWKSAEVTDARAAIDALSAEQRLGAVLVQFPWSFKRDTRSRAWLDTLTTEFADLPLVIEIRHDSWNTSAFFQSLSERGVGFVNIDQPRHRHGLEPTARATGPVGYVRVHGRNAENWFSDAAGVNERYDYLYTADELEPWAARVRLIAERADEVYVVTNNHFEGQAVANAVMLSSMLRGKRCPAPAATVAKYRDVMQDYALPI
jgi:uncharacterized protein YecE (DUF72 family)